MTSLWSATAGETPPGRPSVGTARHDTATVWDTAVVGGGYTGLWTARALLEADPGHRVIVLEATTCGFGASGRNGGWCSALFPTSTATLAERHGSDAAMTMRAAMRDSVAEVAAALAADDIDADFALGGTLTVATAPAHVERIKAHAEDDDLWLSASEATERFATATNFGASYTPHCAAVHPLKLARGLAASVEARGARLAEHSPVAEIMPGRVVTADGNTVRAHNIVRATEGFTASLAGHRRTLAPVYSLMIATEPLPEAVWDAIGLRRRETFSDGRHLIIYGQRTADDRIAFGGRGAPYHFGSAVRPSFDTDDRVFGLLEATLRTLLPQIGSARITHRWGGPLGVPRDWMASVGFDVGSRIGWAGGYVGDGVSTTNLAGRTLADLILERPGGLVELPWVNHRSPRWEPEPLRWLGVNGARSLTELADRSERRRGAPAPTLLSWAIDKVIGG